MAYEVELQNIGDDLNVFDKDDVMRGIISTLCEIVKDLDERVSELGDE